MSMNLYLCFWLKLNRQRRRFQKCSRSKVESSKSARKRSICSNEGMEEPYGDVELELEGYIDIRATNIPERLNVWLAWIIHLS